MTHDIDDDYGTCKETYATLRIVSDSMDPMEISAALKVEPTSSYRQGDAKPYRLATNPTYSTNAWFFSSQGKSSSRDCRRHLDLLIDAVICNADALVHLRQIGCDMDVTIFYSYTQGGPTMSPAQMAALASAGLSVWWDLYRASDDEDKEGGPGA